MARLGTVSRAGQPDVVPVGYEFDGKFFFVGSHDRRIFLKSLKFKNVKSGGNKVALVIDDFESVNPWKVRGIKVYGSAKIVERDGRFSFGE